MPSQCDYAGPGNSRTLAICRCARSRATRRHPSVTCATRRCLTYNVRSYSSIPIDQDARSRADRTIRNLEAAMCHCDVALIQETKLQNDAYYRRFRREWYVFHNPFTENLDLEGGMMITDTESDSEFDSDSDSSEGDYISEIWGCDCAREGTAPDCEHCYDRPAEGKEREAKLDSKFKAKAGTDIFVRKSFAHNFEIEHVVDLTGYIHHLVFTPCAMVNPDYPVFTKSFTIFNVYIPTDSNKAKLSAFESLGKAEVDTDYTLAGGDWNTIPDPSYTVQGGLTTKKVLRTMRSALDALALEEVYDPTMTKISGHSPPQVSRLDRWYISHSQIDRDLYEPQIWLPPHPYEPGSEKTPPSDHFPVLLSFSTTAPRNGGRVIPVWIAGTPEFAREIYDRWEEPRRRSPDPFADLRALDNLMHDVARELSAEGKLRTSTKVEGIALGIAVYKQLMEESISLEEAQARCAGNAALEQLTAPCRDLDSITRVIGELVVPELRIPRTRPYAKVRSTFSSQASSHIPAAPRTGKDFHKQVRSTLGPTRSRLDYLVDEGDRIEDPTTMAEALKAVWGKVWRGGSHDSVQTRRYLRAYKKRISSSPSEVTLDDVIAVLARPRGTCPGPNGVPFLCYSVVCSIAAPIFLRLIKHMMGGGAPPGDFNECNIFFLPKDNSHRAEKTRPIAASNTSSRIVANIIRYKLEGCIHPILSKQQAGFVRGRNIEENILFYNEKFYSALYSSVDPAFPAPGKYYRTKKGAWLSHDQAPRAQPSGDRSDYSILFLDFAKAFDSVSREYLLELLRHIGVPESYRHVIRALFHNVVAHPVVPGKTEVRISMMDGLKQGCPLSPLFFILVIDPLLTLLEKLPNIDPKCFADDLAVGTIKIESILPALACIRRWSGVSGCKPNIDKTKVISTALTDPDLSFLPASWKGIQVSATYTYLGILFGKSVDVNDVYSKALDKLTGRVASYMPIQKYFSMTDRVRIANTYFIPVLSYIFRFFLMSTFVYKKVCSLLRTWLIRGNVTNIHRLMAPSHACGLSNPLKDPSLINTAALIKQGHSSNENLEDLGTFSMKIRDHVAHAAISFNAMVPDVPPEEVLSQGDSTSLMAHAASVPAERLCTTLKTREDRHGGTRDPSWLAKTVIGNTLKLPDTVLPSLRNHIFSLVHNLLFTTHRSRRYSDQEGCAFCGAEKEDYRHLFVDCEVASRARDVVRQRHRARKAARMLDTLEYATEADYRLENPSQTREGIRALACFSMAVWRTRYYFLGKGAVPTATQGAEMIASQYIWTFSNWRKYARRNRDLEAHVFRATLEALPAESIRFYTDGSSYGNPGPAGSGVACYVRGELHSIRTRSLGQATNNAAEMDGVLAALEETRSLPPDLPVYIFVDNRLAINIAVGRSSPEWCEDVAKATRAKMTDTAQGRCVSLYWVPGHAGVDGNEVSDQAAKAGAAGVTGHFDNMDALKDAARAQREAAAPAALQANPGQQGPAVEAKVPSPRCAGCEEVLRKLAAPGRRRRRRPSAARQTPSHSYNTRSRKSGPSVSTPSQYQILANPHNIVPSPSGIVRSGSNFPT